MENERVLILDAVKQVGKKVKLQGWVNTFRDHGKVSFIDLRDTSGVVQCVVVGNKEKITDESVVEIIGTVKERPKESVNKDLPTGGVEVEAESLKVLNLALELPIPVQGDGYDINEEMRLKYRYLDLRRERLQKIVKMRSKLVQAMREKLFEYDFLEIETPMLTKGTSEGARNFIVPSRLNPGKFYALPQSPQQYKQILMVAAMEKYFQVARCIRDEDLRSDRGFEFTQLDLEMSFVSQEDVMRVVEDVVKYAVKSVGANLKDEKFPVINYEDAMKEYGSDKFDLRTEKEKKENVLAFAWVVNFPFFKKVDKEDAAEVEEGRSGWVFTHNPFSQPHEEHLDWHLKGEHIPEIKAYQYDLVCNGLESGGGSIRAHDPKVLRATYEIMGYSEQDIEENIGHMLEAFSLGAPPHGGIALGIDRLIMILAGESSLKEGIAFPMTGAGKTSVMDAPSPVSKDLLKELGIKLVKESVDAVFQRVKSILDAAEVRYEVIEHKEVKTSEEAARVRGTSMDMAPKAMVMKKKSGGMVMVCVPADRKVNIKAVKDVVGEPVEMASPEEVEDKLGVKVGAVPPFGKVFGIEMYLDREFWKKDEVVFNAGRRDRSIKMKASDLIKAAEPNPASSEADFKK
ncbi:aspartate--tRNA ligase [Candidatus Dojkabacteria bacterium]|nr:aspartate--tRNA ligase [Candidatus Dojkabacteria bacterium]